MKIVIVGKGGSGKTTLAATIVRARSEKGKTVLAIDADIKQHLASTLSYSAELMGRWNGALIAAILHNVGTLVVIGNAGRLLKFDESSIATPSAGRASGIAA